MIHDQIKTLRDSNEQYPLTYWSLVELIFKFEPIYDPHDFHGQILVNDDF